MSPFTGAGRRRSGIGRPGAPAFARLCCLLLGLHALPSQGEAWLTHVNVDWSGGYDSNIGLTTEQEEDIFVTDLTTELRAQRLTEISEVRAQAILHLFEDTGDATTGQNSTEQLELFASRQTERHRWGIDSRYFRDTTFRGISPALPTGEDALPADDVVVPDIDTGLVGIEVRRSRLNLQPFWEWDSSERAQLRLAYRLALVTHEDDAVTGLQDFEQHTLAPSWSYFLSERNRLTLNLEASRFETNSGPERTSDSYSLTVGLGHRLSEATRVVLEGGGFYTSFDARGVDGSETGFIFGITALHRLEAGRVRARLQRRLFPSGTGQLVETTRARLDYTRDITARLHAGLTVDAFDTDALGQKGFNDRTYLSVEPTVTWNFSPRLSGSVRYRYRYQSRETEPGSAEGHAVFIGISYILSSGLEPR